jgi:AcrR family transcriptional regulator
VTTSEIGRRERKKLATHQALRWAALRLVAERGLHKVTVEDIAEAADVSVRTFYDHFPSKEDSVVGFDPDSVDWLREALAARPGDEPPLVAIRAVLGELVAPVVDRSEEWLLRMEVVGADPSLLPRMLASFATYERAVVEVIAARTGTDPDRDLYPVLTATVAMGAFRAAMAFWRNSNGALPLPELLDVVFAQVKAGLPAGAAAGRGGGRRRGSSTHVDAPQPARSTAGARTSHGTGRSTGSARA